MADSKEKNSKFAAILSQLRKERGCSQKKAAADLGISQALLSHYEKGIRECGLDFVIKCSDYYGVTTDYLLGVSTSRYGIDEEYLYKISNEGIDGSSMSTVSKGMKILLETAVASTEGTDTIRYLHDYYMLCLYRGALTLAKSGKLPSEMFKLDYTIGHELASAAISLLDARFVFIEDKSRTGADIVNKSELATIIEEAENYLISNLISE
ncbi:MAG: helix-turn-helix transcriptional regulator [Clostridiales bacterium]|nr:helix-turn-helix transcriptional regulator [Clostridiales bacterium]